VGDIKVIKMALMMVVELDEGKHLMVKNTVVDSDTPSPDPPLGCQTSEYRIGCRIIIPLPSPSPTPFLPLLYFPLLFPAPRRGSSWGISHL